MLSIPSSISRLICCSSSRSEGFSRFPFGVGSVGVNLDLEPVQKEEFYPFIESVENVIECNCVTGEYSMLIEVKFLDTEELDEFINTLQKFGKTSTQIVFSTPVEHRGLPVHSGFDA